MDFMPFIEKYLGEFEYKGGKDVKIKTCPYCGSEDYKFLINPKTGRWICNHRNRCGEQGGINKLKLKFGLKVDIKETMESPDNDECLKFDAAKQKEFTFLKKEQLEFFKKRGISEKTLKDNRVCNYKNSIAFPYFKDNNLMTFKYRSLDKKFFQEGGKPVLMGMDDTIFENPLIICEGEMDFLTFKECDIKNVVSVPFGANDLRWIDYNSEYLSKFKEIILCFDNDKAGRGAEEEVKSRIGIEKLKKINLGVYKDINEVLMNEGEGEVLRAAFNLENFDMGGCYNVSDINIDEDEVRAFSSFKSIDNILHGFREKELTVWTGVPGSGKSTILNQIMLQTIEQGGKVAIFSGEMSKERVFKWAMIQYYGWEGCEQQNFKIGDGYFYEPKKELFADFKEKFKDKLFIMEEEILMTDVKLFEKMKYLHFKYGVNRFIFDNLMTVDLGDNSNKYESQKIFVTNCVSFAKKNSCHIDLVAHPRKPSKGELPTMYDISGASEIPNLAHNIVRLEKIEDESKALDIAEEKGLDYLPSTIAVIQKNREHGTLGLAFLGFEKNSKSFYSTKEEKGKKYEIKKDNEIMDFINFFEGEVID